MRKIVILRPEPGASATLERATERGLEAIKLPLFEIERIAWAVPDISKFDGLLVTSANAIRVAGEDLEQLKPLPVYAVGPASGAAAAKSGFHVARIGSARVRGLLRRIDPDLRLLHLAGEDRIDPRSAWQKITVLPVYRARAIEDVDATAIDGSVALVHSQRAGARLAEIARDRSTIAVAALSAAAAEACGEGWKSVSAVAKPSDSALLALAARLCEKNGE
jgi:uroporphyrinogen-III synthase